MKLTTAQVEAMTNTALRTALHHLKEGNFHYAEDHIREILAARLEAEHADSVRNSVS